jgi:hypothetical protein
MRIGAVVIVILAVLALARPAYAYLDPNASSVLLQVILGGLAGVAIAGRLLWHRIKSVFVRDKAAAEPGKGEQEAGKGER